MLPAYASFTAFCYGRGDTMATVRTKVRIASSTHTAATLYTCWSAINRSASFASNATPVECRDMRGIHK
jgi:glutamine synthetase